MEKDLFPLASYLPPVLPIGQTQHRTEGGKGQRQDMNINWQMTDTKGWYHHPGKECWWPELGGLSHCLQLPAPEHHQFPAAHPRDKPPWVSDGQGMCDRIKEQSTKEPPVTGCHISRRPNPRAEVSGTQATTASLPPNLRSTNCSHLYWTSGKFQNSQSFLGESALWLC